MDYELIDSGNGRRLERFGKYVLDRPDPETMWPKALSNSEWDKSNAIFINNKWRIKTNFSSNWQIKYGDLKFILKLTPFKHVGIFPEQEAEWELIANSVQRTVKTTNEQPNILNLFGYTGVASLTALNAGANVTHIDASKPAISWFVDNLKLNNLENRNVRYIPEDCHKFVEREIKRENKYDALIMDPPVYGHGPRGEKWSFTKDFSSFFQKVCNLLSNDPQFVIVNAYAVSTSPTTLENIMKSYLLRYKGKITSGELSLKEESASRILTTGIYSIWQRNPTV